MILKAVFGSRVATLALNENAHPVKGEHFTDATWENQIRRLRNRQNLFVIGY